MLAAMVMGSSSVEEFVQQPVLNYPTADLLTVDLFQLAQAVVGEVRAPTPCQWICPTH